MPILVSSNVRHRNRFLTGMIGIAISVLAPATTFSESPKNESLNREAEAKGTDWASMQTWTSKCSEEMVGLYRWLHSHPEVSFEEQGTSKRIGEEWEKLGFQVTYSIGGHGVVGVLKNGAGPHLMIRTDLDALPVTERTPLPFASQMKTTTKDGSTSGVMHACGHDVHMTSVTYAGKYLAENRGTWKGTLMLIGQPAEERGSGAKAMLEGGLFEKFGKPDYAIALHCESSTPAGKISLKSGYLLANVDSVDIEVKGRGGHGASPESTVDPIVQAAELVLSLQAIVSREIKPIEPAVITVGAIHGGTKHNIISDSCHLQVTVRSYSPEVRKQLLDAIRRRANGVAQTSGAPSPKIDISEGTPALANDERLTSRLRDVLSERLGKDRVLEAEQVMGGEDFSQFGLAGVPIMMYRLGTVSQERIDRFKKLEIPLPSLHSPEYYPDLEGTLDTGVASLVMAAQELLRSKGD